MANAYEKGGVLRLSAAFTDQAGTAVDPAALTARWRKPDGSVTVKTYGSDAELVRVSLGNFRVDVDLDVEGEWEYRFAGTGANAAAGKKRFRVREAEF